MMIRRAGLVAMLGVGGAPCPRRAALVGDVEDSPDVEATRILAIWPGPPSRRLHDARRARPEAIASARP